MGSLFYTLRFRSPSPGPRKIVTAAVHNNKTCSTFALKRLAQEIESDKIKRPHGFLTLVPATYSKAYRLQSRANDRNLTLNCSSMFVDSKSQLSQDWFYLAQGGRCLKRKP